MLNEVESRPKIGPLTLYRHMPLTPLIGDDPGGRAMLATLWRDIPISVEAIRKFWMPFRFRNRPSKPSRRRGW